MKQPSSTAVDGLRVLAFCDYFSGDSSGGAERVAREVYGRLAARGACVTLITATPSQARGPMEVDGLRVHAVRSMDLSGLTRAQVSLAPRAVPEAFRVAAGYRPHVLHANSIHFQTSVAAALLHRSKGIPLVTTVHLSRPSNLPWLTRELTKGYELTVGRFVLRSSGRVIAVSGPVGRHVESLGIPSSKVEVVVNGVDHELFKPNRRARARSKTPVILFVGRLIANKGPQVLLEAANRLAKQGIRPEIVFLGDGPLRSRLMRAAADRGIGGHVHFPGHSSDVPGWLRRADIVVRPSFTEGLPLTVLEAMAAGVCVVASDIPGNAELISHRGNGLLFEVGDPRSLQRELISVLHDPTWRGKLAAAGHQTSLAYSWDACAEAVGGILLAAANGWRAGR